MFNFLASHITTSDTNATILKYTALLLGIVAIIVFGFMLYKLLFGKRPKSIVKFLIATITSIIVLLFLILLLINVADNVGNQDNDDGNHDLFRRSASADDIDVSRYEYVYQPSIKYSVSPLTTIYNLKLKFSFWDEDGDLITTKTETIGDVECLKSYDVEFLEDEFTVSEWSTIDSWEVTVIGGTVKYLW